MNVQLEVRSEARKERIIAAWVGRVSNQPAHLEEIYSMYFCKDYGINQEPLPSGHT